MPTEILISSDPWENRVAILENGSLAEIYIEREEKVIGSIYKGKVQNVLPGMGASFVDIGIGRNAFLYVDDINKTPLNIGDVEITQGRPGWTIGDKVNRGDEVLVQIVKEPRGLKGARVSTNISLPGRYLILMPTGKFSGVSRKIETSEERDRLKNVMKRIRPEGMATIVRTAAAGVSDAELIADLGVLIRMWHGILENYKKSQAPALVHKDMNLVYKAARDFITPEIERVLIDNADECEKLRDFMRLLGPQYVDRISYYPQGKALFRDFKVEDEIARLMRPKVNLPSGGSLVIETTEALTVIDVNSGKYAGGKTHEDTIVHTNVEAAAEIARQVRLRDIGGIIVCDFIDMDRETNRTKVLQTLENGLRRDRTRTTIQSFSALGLLEFTRKRVGKDLSGQLRSSCPTCRGIGNVLSPETVTIETFRVVDHNHGNSQTPLSIVASPTVGAQMRYWHEDELAELSRKHERQVNIVVDPSLHPERTRVTADASHLPVVQNAPIRVGDELEVDVLPFRMPVAGTGIALVGNRFIEIENASGAIGSSLGVRIIDIDDESGEILAEPRGPQPTGEKRRRRKKRGRSADPAEQAEELRELAEEAERISSQVTAAAAAAAAAPPAPPRLPPSRVFPEDLAAAAADGDQRRGRHNNQQGQGQPQRNEQQRNAPQHGRRHPGNQPFRAVAPLNEAAGDQPQQPAPAQPNQPPQRRNMRLADGISVPAHAVEQLDDADGDEIETTEGAFGEAVPFSEGQRRRRRRRRRGRGRGNGPEGTQGASTQTEPGAVPQRTIFRASQNGLPEATGQISPPEPNRAIAPWRPRPAHIATDAPPPSLHADETGGPPLARPARRRGRPAKAGGPAGQLTAANIPALPDSRHRRDAEQQPLLLPDGSEYQQRSRRPADAPSGRPIPVTPPRAAAPAAAPAEPAKRRGRPPRSEAAANATATGDSRTATPTRGTAAATVPTRATAAASVPTRATATTPARAAAPAPTRSTAGRQAAALVETEAPKRRGRPPKAIEPEPAPKARAKAAPAAKATATAAKPAAKPGRPRKAEAEPEAPKRGRPRKNA